MEISNSYVTGLPEPFTPIVVISEIISHEEALKKLEKLIQPRTEQPSDEE